MITIGLGEHAITSDNNETIITHSLGSCVAFIIYAKPIKTVAMAHIVLPRQSENQYFKPSIKKDAYFARDIVPKLLKYYLEEMHCPKSSLEIILIGGAKSRYKNDVFNVGEQNIMEIINILKDKGLRYCAKETGGHESRTVEIKVNNKEINIRKQKMII